jgi:flavin prenyltransferase
MTTRDPGGRAGSRPRAADEGATHGVAGADGARPSRYGSAGRREPGGAEVPAGPLGRVEGRSQESPPVVLGVTGASGALYGTRLLRALLLAGRRVDLIFTEYGLYLLKLELGLHSASYGRLDELRQRLELSESAWRRVRLFRNNDLAGEPASGSSRFAGVAVCPCSMKNLAAIATGLSETLLQRAADVALKERRPLVLVPRETPLNLVHLENMTRLARAGATLIPAMPAFYQMPRTFEDLADFIAARVLDHLGIENDLVPSWGEVRRGGRAAAGARPEPPVAAAEPEIAAGAEPDTPAGAETPTARRADRENPPPAPAAPAPKDGQGGR